MLKPGSLFTSAGQPGAKQTGIRVVRQWSYTDPTLSEHGKVQKKASEVAVLME